MKDSFPNFPPDLTCPICGQSGPGEGVMIGIDGTSDGRIEQAAIVHVECITPDRMRFNRNVGVIYLRTIPSAKGTK